MNTIMKEKTRVVIVGTVGIPACYGGFESLVENLTLHKSDNVNYTVFCSSKAYKTKLKFHNGAELVYLPWKANGLQSIFYDIFSLVKCIFLKPDVVLILGVSGCIFLPFFKLFSTSKIITNIDGLEWKRNKWSVAVKKFLKFSEMVAVKFSDVVVTDNKAIGDYVDSEYRRDNVTIAYGGDHAIRNSLTSIAVESTEHNIESYSLGLCRIEPENNVEMILDAFTATSKKIKFVGNWGASEYGQMLKNKYKEYGNIELLDPIYDLDILYELRSRCSLYLHGHSAGGTNPSLVEMMHFGVPIIAFDCKFNRYSTDDKAIYFKSKNDLIEIIQKVDKKTLIDVSTNMKAIAEERYTWREISRQYEVIY